MEKVTNKRNHKKNNVEGVFQNLNRNYIKMNKKEKKENTDILFSVLSEIIDIIRKHDKLFNSLKPKLDFLGSYFDGLRVGQPTEYDINVILTFPVNYGKIKLDCVNSVHDYTAVVMPSEFRRLSKVPDAEQNGFSKTQLWCDKEYRLSVSKFRAWMQSAVDSALNTLPLKEGKRILQVNKHTYRLYTKLSGPATTITILKKDNTLIDVDLVPTFEFKLPTKPLHSKVCFLKLESTKINKYFVVPKPSNDDYSWRLTFPFQERYYLKKKDNLKAALRLIKHFRDIQGFTKLCSYYIKTLFLWECLGNDDSYWKINSLSSITLNMLRKLKNCLENKKISNFWCPDHNIIETIKPATCEHWCNRVTYILNDIECKQHKCPNIILHYFSRQQ